MANITVPIHVDLPDDWIDQIIERLRNDPEAEWVEIIRCKDCKHRPVADADWQDGFDIEFPDNRCPCHCDDDYYNWLPDDDWFCGNAEPWRGEEDGV